MKNKRKRFLLCLMLLILPATGCARDYSTDKPVIYERMISRDEAIAEIEKKFFSEDKDIFEDCKNVTMKLHLKKEDPLSSDGISEMDYLVKYKRKNNKINGSVDFHIEHYDFNMFVKDNVIYVCAYDGKGRPIGDKIKSTIPDPSSFDFEDLCMKDKRFTSFFEGFLDTIKDWPEENLQAGYDREGALIFENKGENALRFRFVMKNDLPLYLSLHYYKHNWEYKFDYGKPRIKQPKGFKKDDKNYEEIKWKDFLQQDFL